jgi:MoaA/NifB/PqqE/SkfB family radical SAM enzyme
MSQAGVYSESKLTWWYAREQKLPEVPKQVQLILSDLCNQDCHFCAYRQSGYTSNELFTQGSELSAYGHDNPKRWIPTDRALRLIDEFKELGVLAVQFTGGGEPTVHPDHEVVFDKTLALGLRGALVSNGLRWSDNLIRLILPRFDWVRVSIDAGTAASYSRIRRTPTQSWNRVWRNIGFLASEIKVQGSPTVLGLGFVVTPDSYKEIHKFASLAKENKAHNVRFTAMFSNDNEAPFLRMYDEILAQLQQAKNLESDSFKVYDNFGSRFDDLKQQGPDYPTCGYQHYTTYVGGDLKAYRCCVQSYSRRGLIQGGDLSHRSFSEFWNSKDRKDDFGSFDARGCSRCQFNVQNRSLLYVMGNTSSDAVSRHLEWP